MRRLGAGASMLALTVALVSQDAAAVTGAPAPCAVRGGGTIPAGDAFGGGATADVSGFADGRWTNRSDTGERLLGDVEWLRCREDGGGPAEPPPGNRLNIASFGGSGRWNGMDVEWEGYAEDRGEPNVRDYYGIFVLDGGGVLYASQGTVEAGNIQIFECSESCPLEEE